MGREEKGVGRQGEGAGKAEFDPDAKRSVHAIDDESGEVDAGEPAEDAERHASDAEAPALIFFNGKREHHNSREKFKPRVPLGRRGFYRTQGKLIQGFSFRDGRQSQIAERRTRRRGSILRSRIYFRLF
jgi:hypothetical protein